MVLGICPIHGHTAYEVRPDGFKRCRLCRAANAAKTRKKLKAQLVEYKGGCCYICGYDRCIQALDFHHRYPEDKSFNIARNIWNYTMERMEREADKCVLLCANCHREIHFGTITLPD